MFLNILAHKKYISLILVLVFLIGGIVLFPALIKALFSTPINLTTDYASDPCIDMDSNGSIHVVWREYIGGGSIAEIVYAKSTDDGDTFPEASRINVSSNLNFNSMNPWLRVDGNNVIHIVWEEDTASGEAEIYYTKSIDGGTSFSTPKNLSNNATLSISPYIETSSGNKINITWTDVKMFPEELSQVFYVSSTNGGDNFSSPINISNISHDVDNSVIQVNGDFIIVIWQAEGPDYGIYRVVSSDNGVNFGTALNLSSDTGTRMHSPVVDIDGDGWIHVAATAFVYGNPEVFYWRSSDNGVTFESTVNLSNTPEAVSELPSLLAVGSKTVHIAWAEDICNEGQCVKRVYRSKSSNNGKTFSKPSTPGPLQVFAGVEESDFDVFGSDLYVIWQQGGTIRFIKGK